jgi:hypothetical protein
MNNSKLMMAVATAALLVGTSTVFAQQQGGAEPAQGGIVVGVGVVAAMTFSGATPVSSPVETQPSRASTSSLAVCWASVPCHVASMLAWICVIAVASWIERSICCP